MQVDVFINFDTDDVSSIYGAGYRLFLKEGDYLGELKVEPLIRDNTYFYIQHIMSSNGIKYSLKDIFEHSSVFIDKLNNQIFNDVIDKIIN